MDTPLLGLLSFKNIDQLPPYTLISVVVTEDSEKIIKKIWRDTLGWIRWQQTGFDLALQPEKCPIENPGIKGIVLARHGLFTLGKTSYECYINCLKVINQASEYITKEKGGFFWRIKIKSFSPEKRIGGAINSLRNTDFGVRNSLSEERESETRPTGL